MKNENDNIEDLYNIDNYNNLDNEFDVNNNNPKEEKNDDDDDNMIIPKKGLFGGLLKATK